MRAELPSRLQLSRTTPNAGCGGGGVLYHYLHRLVAEPISVELYSRKHPFADCSMKEELLCINTVCI